MSEDMQEKKPDFRIPVIIPTLNASSCLSRLLESLQQQNDVAYVPVVVDSSSDDDTVAIAQCFGCDVITIERAAFHHGRTRWEIAQRYSASEFLVYVTQDVVFDDSHALKNLLRAFEDEQVGCAYGRQLPHHDADVLAAHARLFNYPAESRIKTKADIPTLGIKTAFCSNSFAAYRRTALEAIGGFPPTRICEDMCAAAKMILAGWSVAYVAEATVRHSHNLTLAKEYARYAATGQFHREHPWLLETFGKATGEGLRFVRSEMVYVLHHRPQALPLALLHDFVKFVAYRIGAMGAS